MKKLLFFCMVFPIFFSLQAQSVCEKDVARYTANLTPEANYIKIERSGNHLGAVQFAKDYINNVFNNNPRYTAVRPASGDERTWVDMDLRSATNSIFNGGALLDPNNRGHHRIYDNEKQMFLGPAACLNGELSVKTYRIISCPSSVVSTKSTRKSTTSVPAGSDVNIYIYNDENRTNAGSNTPAAETFPKERNVFIGNPTPNTGTVRYIPTTVTGLARMPVQTQGTVNYQYPVSACESHWRSKYPVQWAEWDRTHRRSAFRTVPTRDRNQVKKCALGTGWFGRHVAVIAPVVVGLAAGTYAILSDGGSSGTGGGPQNPGDDGYIPGNSGSN